jgi:hypothetical protein
MPESTSVVVLLVLFGLAEPELLYSTVLHSNQNEDGSPRVPFWGQRAR